MASGTTPRTADLGWMCSSSIMHEVRIDGRSAPDATRADGLPRDLRPGVPLSRTRGDFGSKASRAFEPGPTDSRAR